MINDKDMETTNRDMVTDYKIAEVQLSYHPAVKPSECPKIGSSSDAYKVFLQSWDNDKLQFIEQCKLMLISRANRVLGILEISSGGMICTVVDPKLVFVAALKSGCTGILICHNHPSGNLLPSEPDKRLTNRIKAGCGLLEIAFLDHLIITAEGFTSFADEGLL